MDFNFDASAFDDFELSLRELEDHTAQKRVLKSALRKAAKPTLDDMRARYQRQFHDDTGLLARSFRTRVVTDKKTGTISAYTGVQSKRAAMRATSKKRQMPPSAYAYFLEHGTDAYTNENGKTRRGIVSKAFYTPRF